jgi:hypothetical protein
MTVTHSRSCPRATRLLLIVSSILILCGIFTVINAYRFFSPPSLATITDPEVSVSPLPLSNELLPPAVVCVRSGCSGQLCVDGSFDLGQIQMSTCQWQPEYACYQQARCEVQDNGRCGFTPSDELTACIEEKTSLPTVFSSPIQLHQPD